MVYWTVQKDQLIPKWFEKLPIKLLIFCKYSRKLSKWFDGSGENGVGNFHDKQRILQLGWSCHLNLLSHSVYGKWKENKALSLIWWKHALYL